VETIADADSFLTVLLLEQEVSFDGYDVVVEARFGLGSETDCERREKKSDSSD
jgi:hypothetical protein